MGPSGPFYSFIYLPILMIGTRRSWLELPYKGDSAQFPGVGSGYPTFTSIPQVDG